ncbi:MAG: VWA domain-containing protein, partial [Hyphomicrobium sp.]
MKSLAPATTTGRGRLVFAMDATMSRQPTWDMALATQADMFEVVKSVGLLDVQLVYFRGNSECRASKWVSDPAALARLMTTVSCQGGHTQIGKVLTHTRSECEERKLNALVYVGDAMEEDIDDLCHRAGALALLGVPVFLFQEGHDS